MKSALSLSRFARKRTLAMLFHVFSKVDNALLIPI